MAPGLALNLLLLLFLLFLLLAAPARAQDPPPSEVTGAVGGAALLNPQSPQDPSGYSQLHWRWGNQLRIASQRRGEQPSYPQTQFRGRLQLLAGGALRLSPLRLGDGGEFLRYLEDEAGRESVQSVLLRVYELVPKPQVTATTHGDPQVCNTTLRCWVALQGVTYEWIPPQQPQVRPGPVLQVSMAPAAETYVCRVSNAASSSNASLTFRRPCSWTGESSSSAACAAPGALLAFVLLFLLLTAP